MIEVQMPDGSVYRVSRLFSQPTVPVNQSAMEDELLRDDLNPMRRRFIVWQLKKGTVGGNTKTSKGVKKDYTSIGLSLAPNKESGYNVCPNTTPGCTTACLYNGGVTTAWKQIKPAQIAKTRALFLQRDTFDRMLLKELTSFDRKFKENKVCRLNVYSDLPWERMTPWVFERFPDIQFYDYTKIPTRIHAFLDGNFPKNYHLTFSRSEVNEDECRKVLAKGGNVATVFPVDQFPEKYLDHEVIDGDVSDLRFLDPRPCIVGLKAKNKFGRHDQTGFVVRISLPMAQ